MSPERINAKLDVEAICKRAGVTEIESVILLAVIGHGYSLREIAAMIRKSHDWVWRRYRDGARKLGLEPGEGATTPQQRLAARQKARHDRIVAEYENVTADELLDKWCAIRDSKRLCAP